MTTAEYPPEWDIPDHCERCGRMESITGLSPYPDPDLKDVNGTTLCEQCRGKE